MIKIPIFERFMNNMFKYTVAGHTFSVVLPEGFSPQEYLKPYEPFVENGDIDPLFTLELQVVPSLRDKAQGKVRECLNDEAPYFCIRAPYSKRFATFVLHIPYGKS